MAPATRDEFRVELTACIALCMPAGFDETARREWLTAAWGTLNGIPADLLKIGCEAARRHADHPSKVVPTIMREVETLWKARKGNLAHIRADRQPAPVECRIEPPIERIPLAELRAMPSYLLRMGLNAGWISQEDYDRVKPDDSE